LIKLSHLKKAAKTSSGRTVNELLVDTFGKLKENMNIQRTARLDGPGAAYVHHNGKLAAMLELACETDFVARNEEFKALAEELALQVAAMDPSYVSPETIPSDEVEKKRAAFMVELVADNKPEDIKQKIVEGKLNKWYSDVCLTKQTLIKDESKTVEQLLNEKVVKIGEKIVPTRFARMQLGK
jgi:elongation factor Ts